jgi:regulator of sigma E protease
MINFALLLSVNLGVMNLLPLPALDGGRLLFLFIEVVRGKPIPPEKEGIVHFIGFVALMILMVFVLYNDIVKIFA